MLLAIDVGNTNTVFAVFRANDDDTPRGQWRAMTDARRTSDEYAVWLGQLMGQAGFGLADVDEAIVSTVVPQGLAALKALCRDYCGCAARVVGEAGVDLGIAVNVPRPEEVGADRLVNAVGAHIRYPGALVVLDFGTATTFDAVSAEGAYEGGIIAPGINLSLEALHQAAAQLPRIAVTKPETVIGRATVPAMQSGIYWGYVGLIEGIVVRMKEEMGEPMTTVATGGLAGIFGDATKTIDTVDPDLTIRGLREIHRRNRGRG
jgi:type III pantothenate kinase